MTEHTPGPWMTINERLRDDCEWRVLDTEETGNDCWQICQCFGPDAEANARLIASAPDLLAALVRLRGDYNRGRETRIPYLEDAMEQASAAIAKARGEQP